MTEGRAYAPWVQDSHVAQDLILRRALVAGGGRHLPVIPSLAPVLGPAGLAHLKQRLAEHDS